MMMLSTSMQTRPKSSKPLEELAIQAHLAITALLCINGSE
jgi:hypothetical protein